MGDDIFKFLPPSKKPKKPVAKETVKQNATNLLPEVDRLNQQVAALTEQAAWLASTIKAQAEDEQVVTIDKLGRIMLSLDQKLAGVHKILDLVNKEKEKNEGLRDLEREVLQLLKARLEMKQSDRQGF